MTWLCFKEKSSVPAAAATAAANPQKVDVVPIGRVGVLVRSWARMRPQPDGRVPPPPPHLDPYF